jgi:putative aldouronate transport system permease protein
MDWAPGDGTFLSMGIFCANNLLAGWGITQIFGSADGFYVADGKVQNYYTDTRYRDLVKFLNKCYAAGLINTETFTQDYTKFQAVTRNPDAPVVGFTFGWDLTDRFGPKWAPQYETLAPMKPNASYTGKVSWDYSYDGLNYGANLIEMSAKAKDKTAAMRFIDQFYIPRNSIQVLFGSIGPNIKENADGSLVILPPTDSNMDPGTWKWTSALADDGPMYISDSLKVTLGTDMQALARIDQVYAPYVKAINLKKDVLPVTFMKYSSDDNNAMALLRTNLGSVTASKFANWVTKGGIDKEWDQYVKDVQKTGLAQYTQILQKYYDTYIKGLKVGLLSPQRRPRSLPRSSRGGGSRLAAVSRGCGASTAHRVDNEDMHVKEIGIPGRPTTGRWLGAAAALRRDWQLWVLVAPAVIVIAVFNYIPMYGIQLAFRDFNFAKGLTGGAWRGLFYFNMFTNSFQFWTLLKNTFVISLTTIVLGFPAPIILALLFNQIQGRRTKRILQTVVYMPHFISTVVMVGLLTVLLSPNTGVIGMTIKLLGLGNVNLMGEASTFVPTYVISDIWQHAGWGSIIYLAALSSVDQQLYDASRIDGANRWQVILHVDVPALVPTILILFILTMGNVLNTGFEKIYLMQKGLNLPVSEVIATYVYKIGIVSNQYSYSAAIGVFNTVINFVFLFGTNSLSRRFSTISLW